MKHPISIGLAVLALLSGSAALAAEPYKERLTVPLSDPGRPAHVEVSLVMGGVTVVGGAVTEVVVEASSRDGDESEETHETRREHKGMKRIPNTAFGLEAEEKDNRVEIGSSSWAQSIDLRITVPVGSSLELQTVNDGDITVEGVEGELALHNTNGEIHVTDAKGPVSAATVNGDVTVVFRKNAAPAAPMAFSTLNGDVEVTLPAGLKADVKMRSDNGDIFSDFDVVLDRKPATVETSKEKGRYRVTVQREVTGKIGGGGPELLVKTFNGDILLKRTGG